MCQMWMVQKKNGSELMFPSDEQLFQLLKINPDVVLVYEQKTGKPLIDRRPAKPNRNLFITKLFRK